MSEAEIREELARTIEERDDAQTQLADAQIDSEEIGRLRAAGKTAEEALDAVTLKLKESTDAGKRLQFETKRDVALRELSLKLDHPAVALAFPDDAVLDDTAFAGRVESLKAIVATSKPGDPPVPGGDDPNPADAWKDRGVAPSESHIDGTEAITEGDKRAAGAKEQFNKTRDPRHLVGAVYGKVMKIVQRRMPGGSTYYDREEVKQ